MSATEQPPRATLVRIGRADDVPLWEGRAVTVAGRRLAIFRTDEGFFALANACPHLGGPLSDGIVGDGCVTCPLHGRRFDLRSGDECSGGEGVDRFAVVERAGELFVAA